MAEQLFLKWQNTERDTTIKKVITMIQIFDNKLKNKIRNCFNTMRCYKEMINKNSVAKTFNTGTYPTTTFIVPYITTEGQKTINKKSKLKKANEKKVKEVEDECYSIRVLDKKLNITTLTQRNGSKKKNLIIDTFNKNGLKHKIEVAQHNSKTGSISNIRSKLLHEKLKRYHNTQKGSGDVCTLIEGEKNNYYKIHKTTKGKVIENTLSSRKSSGEWEDKENWKQWHEEDDKVEVQRVVLSQKRFDSNVEPKERSYSPYSQRNKVTHKVIKRGKQFSERKEKPSAKLRAKNIFEKLCSTNKILSKKSMKNMKGKYIPSMSIDPNICLESDNVISFKQANNSASIKPIIFKKSMSVKNSIKQRYKVS